MTKGSRIRYDASALEIFRLTKLSVEVEEVKLGIAGYAS